MRNISLYILDFFESIDQNRMHVFLSFKRPVEYFYNLRDLKNLRKTKTELLKMCKILEPGDYNRLCSLLLAKFQVDLKIETEDDMEKIRKIIQRGKIITRKEYELLLDYLDLIEGDQSKKDEVKQVFSLIEQYQLEE